MDIRKLLEGKIEVRAFLLSIEALPSGFPRSQADYKPSKKEEEMDRKMFAKGYKYKVVIDPKEGEPLYVKSFNQAIVAVKEYFPALAIDLEKQYA